MTTTDEVIDLIETIWLPLDPHRTAEWHSALRGKDLVLAETAIITLRDATNAAPSTRKFEATYRGLLKEKPKDPSVSPEWFKAQREKLRQPLEESRPES